MTANNHSSQSLLKREATCSLPTEWGKFTMVGYTELANNKDHVALYMGDITTPEPVLLRVHSECLTGDAFFSQKCDCGPQLEAAFKMIQAEGRGVIIYLRQEGRGIGLINKIKAYHLQDQGLDTVEANLALHLPIDARNFQLAKDILDDLNINEVKLMTNNPNKIDTLKDSGINVVERIPVIIETNPNNEKYIQTKKNKLHHLFDD
ncbi:GTP cyclohydrolase II [Neisseriaceae bacterium PsAf]|nr:GTP cyclohydrolase II [Neisseriaceae bacterium PsAf]